MTRKMKLGIGAVLAVIGGFGMALGPILGFTRLTDPWSFIAGFIMGIMAGIGVALSVWGLVDKRRSNTME